MSRFDDQDADYDNDEEYDPSVDFSVGTKDNNGDGDYLLQGVLYKYKTGFFGTSWKAKYVTLDAEKLLLWAGEQEPSASGNNSPDDGFLLERCIIKEEDESITKRKYCFSVVVNSDPDTKVILCCKNGKEYDDWYSNLSSMCSASVNSDVSPSKSKSKNSLDDSTSDKSSVEEAKEQSNTKFKPVITAKPIIKPQSSDASFGGGSTLSFGVQSKGSSLNKPPIPSRSQPNAAKIGLSSTIQQQQTGYNATNNFGGSSSSNTSSVLASSKAASNSKGPVKPTPVLKSTRLKEVDDRSQSSSQRSYQSESTIAVALVVQDTLWKYKSGIFGSTWKERYVYSDDEKLLQFPDADKPTTIDDLPDFFVALKTCKVERNNNLRKYAFTVTNTSPDVPENTKITLAADDEETYKRWILHMEKYCLVGKRDREELSKGSTPKSVLLDDDEEINFEERSSRDSFGDNNDNVDDDEDFDYDNVNFNTTNNARANNDNYSLHSSDFNKSGAMSETVSNAGISVSESRRAQNENKGSASTSSSQSLIKDRGNGKGGMGKVSSSRVSANEFEYENESVASSAKNSSVPDSDIGKLNSTASEEEGDGKRGYNKQGQLVYVEGRLWKMKAGTFTGITWKPKWVYLDYDKLLQWSGEYKPDADTQPSNGMPLKQCQVKESKYRVYAFTITNVDDSSSLTFAASNAVEYDNFMQLFKRYSTIVDADGKIVNKSDLFDESDNDTTSEKVISVLLDSDDDDDKSEDTDFGFKDQKSKVKKGLKTPLKQKQSLNELVSPALREKHILPLAKGYSRDIQADSLLFLEGPLLKLKSAFLTGKEQWKIKWVYADSNKFLQWQTETKPDSSVLPNVGFPLGLSSLEKHPHKDTPFAFRLIEKSSKTNLIFATANEDDYKAWMKLLMKSVDDVSAELEAELAVSRASDDGGSVDGKSTSSVNLDIDTDDGQGGIDETPSNLNEAMGFGGAGDVDLDEFVKDKLDPYNENDDDSTSDFSIETMSTVVGKFRPLEQDVIMDLFIQYNIVKSVKNPHIAFESIAKIVSRLGDCDDYHFVDPLVGVLIYKDLGLDQEVSAISYGDFIQWWEEHRMLRTRPNDPLYKEKGVGWRATNDSSSHHFGTISCGQYLTNVQISRLVSINLPSLDSSSRSKKPFILSDRQNWNTLYQDILDKVLQGSSSNYGIAKNFDSRPRHASRFDNRFNLKDFVKLQRIHGSFTQTATATAAALIDEFCLPDDFKTFDVVQDKTLLTKYTVGGDRDFGDALVYGSGGIIFIITEVFAAKSVDDTFDASSSPSLSSARLQPVDELFRKICGNEAKALKALNKAVSSYYKDMVGASKTATSNSKSKKSSFRPSTMLSSVVDIKGFRVNAICPVDVNGDDTLVYGVNQAGDYFYNKNAKLTSYFTTFGLSYLNLQPVNCTYKIFGNKMKLKDAKYDTVPIVSKKLQAHFCFADNRIYISSAKCLSVPDLPEVINQNKNAQCEEELSRQFRLNVDITFNALSTETKHLRQEFVSSLSEPLSCDLFKHSNILKESDSTSAYEKLRYLAVDGEDLSSQASFQMSYRNLDENSMNIDNYIDSESDQADMNNANGGATSPSEKSVASALSGISSRIGDYVDPVTKTVEMYTSKTKQTAKLANYLRSINQLYLKNMKTLATKMDTLECCPLDSYSLTELIHKEGLCCRHLGLVFDLAKTVHTKQIILVEMVARSVKTILNQSMRHFTRDCKAKVDEYLQSNSLQGRNFQEDYCRKMIGELNGDFSHVIVDLFNLVLGFGHEVKEFWCGADRGVLMNMISQKFGLELDFEESLRLITPCVNQMFVAMQYHTGNLFDENCMLVPVAMTNPNLTTSDASIAASSPSSTPGGSSSLSSAVQGSKFHNSRYPKPLSVDDLLEEMQPLAKADVRFPGLYNDVDNLCDAFLHNDLPELAVKALQLRILANKAVNGEQNALKVSMPLAWNIYKLALALYSVKDYAQAKVVLFEFLYSNPKYTPVCGKMTSLLMSIEMDEGNFEQALLYFETATVIYRVTLGTSHPIHAFHAMALSDSYYALTSLNPFKSNISSSNGGFNQAKAMASLAYEALRGTLGDLHVTTARFGLKLGAILLEAKQFDEAAELLSSVLLTLDIYSKRNIFYISETAKTLHALSIALSEIGQLQHAHHCATRCIGYYSSEQLKMDRSVYVSMFLLMTKLCEKSTAVEDQALSKDFMATLWMESKRRPHAFGGLGEMLISLSVHTIHALFEKQTFAAKQLVMKIHDKVKESIEKKIIVKSAYDRALLLVATNLWNGNAHKYFASLLELIQKMESSGLSGNIKDMVGHHTTELELVQLQTSIVFAMVEKNELNELTDGFDDNDKGYGGRSRSSGGRSVGSGSVTNNTRTSQSQSQAQSRSNRSNRSGK